MHGVIGMVIRENRKTLMNGLYGILSDFLAGVFVQHVGRSTPLGSLLNCLLCPLARLEISSDLMRQSRTSLLGDLLKARKAGSMGLRIEEIGCNVNLQRLGQDKGAPRVRRKRHICVSHCFNVVLGYLVSGVSYAGIWVMA